MNYPNIKAENTLTFLMLKLILEVLIEMEKWFKYEFQNLKYIML